MSGRRGGIAEPVLQAGGENIQVPSLLMEEMSTSSQFMSSPSKHAAQHMHVSAMNWGQPSPRSCHHHLPNRAYLDANTGPNGQRSPAEYDRPERDDGANTLMTRDDWLNGPVCAVTQGERNVRMAYAAVL